VTGVQTCALPISYSVIAPECLFSKDIRASYRDICSCIIKGLARIGISADFRPINDVVVGGKKVSGSAQMRRHGVLSQHGTVLFGLDRKTMFSVLMPSPLKLSDKPAENFESSVTCVNELCDVSFDGLYAALLEGFTEGKEWQYGELSERELALAKEMEWKYTSYEWNFSR
jgi:lipoate-protein ligase A